VELLEAHVTSPQRYNPAIAVAASREVVEVVVLSTAYGLVAELPAKADHPLRPQGIGRRRDDSGYLTRRALRHLKAVA